MSRRWALAAGVALALAGLSIGKVALGPFEAASRPTSESALRACRCAPERDVSFARADGLRLAGSLYGFDRQERRAAFLLLHGRRTQGRALPLYRVLATHLAARGYAVFAIDLAGFGASEDPFRLEDPSAVTHVPDVEAALGFLAAQAGVDATRIRLIGHSMGAGVALQVGIAHPLVRGIVAIAPARRVAERLRDEPGFRSQLWSRFQQTYRQRGRPVPEWYVEEDFLAGVRSRNVVQQLSVLGRPGHKPVLLVDGGREPPEDLAFLRDFVARTAPPLEHVTLPDADHFANTYALRGDMQLYDAPVMDRLVAAIHGWAQQDAALHPGL